jgi:uncharacterized surface protein with fasciclin (FAS1) repeats
MKNNLKNKTNMKYSNVYIPLSVCRTLLGWGLCALLCLWVSCEDTTVNDEQFTKKSEMLVTAFLEASPNDYSDFLDLMYATGTGDLLNAYGYYTCFIPNNTAMQAYYRERNTSFDQLTREEKLEIVQDHIIAGKTKEELFWTSSFPDGPIQAPTMSNRFVQINAKLEEGSYSYYVNDNSRVIYPFDQEVHNGVIHTIGQVVGNSKVQLADVIASDERFSLFAEALMLTGLGDSLRALNNDLYDAIREAIPDPDKRVQSQLSYEASKTYATPAFCKYGYTALIESNETYAAAGINDLESLKQYADNIYSAIYPQDRNITDPTDRRNSLNRFVAYHLLDREVAYSEFINSSRADYYVPNWIVADYLTTLCPNTLMKVQRSANIENGKVLFNRRTDNTGGITINEHYRDKRAENGYYHEIEQMLTYADVEESVLNGRLRMEISSLMPEMATNRLRMEFSAGGYVVPQYYYKNLTYTEVTQLQYNGSTSWADCEGDEFLFVGKYDFTLHLPPIPKGTYEVRIGYTANPERGVAQLYFDNKPCGIPLNMTIQANNEKIGWVKDVDGEPEAGIENDKMMRNRGYLKGPNSIWTNSSQTILRNNSQSLRRVVTIETFTEAKPHTLRIKSVEELTTRQFHLDYIEFVPNTYWEQEGQD